MKLLIILVLLSFCGCTPKSTAMSASNDYTCTELTITKVGGCKKSGYCGVIYSNGEKGGEYIPVEGEKVKVCKHK